MVPVDALKVENVCLLNDHHVISFVSENQSLNLFLGVEIGFGRFKSLLEALGCNATVACRGPRNDPV